MKDLLKRLPDSAVLVDSFGVITGINPALTALLGYGERELVGHSVDVLVPRRARAAHAEHRRAFVEAAQARSMAPGRRLEAQHKDGRPIPVEISLTPLTPEQGGGVLVLMRGIAERLALESRARLADAVVAATANPLLVTDALGRIVLVNEAFTRLTGWTADEVLGENPRFLKSGAHPPEHYRELWATLNDGRTWHGELVNVKKDGTRYIDEQTITPIKNAEGAVTHFVSLKSDVTERHQQAELTARNLQQLRVLHDLSKLGARAVSTAAFANGAGDLLRTRLGLAFATVDTTTTVLSGERSADRDELLVTFGDETLGRLIVRFATPAPLELHALLAAAAAHLGTVLHTLGLIEQLRTRASTDPLTVLANRAALVERGNQEVERAHRYGRPLSVILLDIDHFKQANDRYGHPFGDEVLREVGAILGRQRRASDLAARYGGDELVLLLPETRLEDARVIAERIRTALGRHRWSIAGVHVSASYGVSELAEHTTLAELLAAADDALYRAKGEGRDRVSTLPALPGQPGSQPGRRP